MGFFFFGAKKASILGKALRQINFSQNRKQFGLGIIISDVVATFLFSFMKIEIRDLKDYPWWIEGKIGV